MERNYEVVSSRYGEDAGRGLTGRRMNPYQRRPERARWTEREVRRYADGTTKTFTRQMGRWGGVYCVGEWTEQT
jgi:hypothetical protein